MLSWHVPNCVSIKWSVTESQQREISIEFELRAKYCKWNKPMGTLHRPIPIAYRTCKIQDFLVHTMTSSDGNISASLAICVGNSPVTGEFLSQRSVTRNSDVFFDLCPNKRLSKQWWERWFETPSSLLLRYSNSSLSDWVGTSISSRVTD